MIEEQASGGKSRLPASFEYAKRRMADSGCDANLRRHGGNGEVQKKLNKYGSFLIWQPDFGAVGTMGVAPGALRERHKARDDTHPKPSGRL